MGIQLSVIELERLLTSEMAAATPFRVLTLIIFILAITHTFLAHQFTLLAMKVTARHARRHRNDKQRVSFLAEVLFFFGEIEIVFALWVIPLVIVITLFFGWDDVTSYLNSRVYVEPLFVVVIMSLASTRPILKLAERGMQTIANFFGNGRGAWWLSILTIGPILGCIITEAAAMTIAALLLQRQIYIYAPSKRLAYATLGLLFVNFSVGGVLTNFAAPPALTLSRCWGWEVNDFFKQFALPVLVGICLVNTVTFFLLRRDFVKLKKIKHKEELDLDKDKTKGAVPLWVTLCHLLFISGAVICAHYPPIFMGIYLLFLGFHQATRHHQFLLDLKRPLLVGLFLAGLVIHAGFQGWWIEPLIGDLDFGQMMLAGATLTAFNENSTVAALACLLKDLTPQLKYAIVSGLVAGGGLTVIAHAPNPAGLSLLRKYFKGGVSPWNLFLAALPATIVFLILFYVFKILVA